MRRSTFLTSIALALGLALGLAPGLLSASVPAAKGKRPGQVATSAGAAAPSFQGRDEVQRFALEVTERQGLDLAWVQAQLGEARFVGAVRKFIMPPPPGTAKNWAAYRAIFIEPRRIQAGLNFWRQHEAWLQRAEARWGVPPEIVVGIIGVETFYGSITGNYRVLDALATLAFDFPPGRKDRSEFFKSELEQLLVLSAREGIAASSVRGSFAGAIGLPQFMPGSINRWAVDFDEDGHVDLRSNAADAIGSVAHYLAAFGWQQDLPTHFDVAVPVAAADRAFLLGPDIVPSFSPAQFVERGALLPEAAMLQEGLMALVELQNGAAAPSYIAGTANFYAVTRYNWSSYYALAVIELGAAVARERRRLP